MERIFIWGTGFISHQIIDECNVFSQSEVLGFIDNDIEKTGKKFYDKEIFSPSILCRIIPDKIVVLTDSYSEIKYQILQLFPEMSSIIENKNYFYKQRILKRYKNSTEPEILEILDYLENNNLDVFNYKFVKKYEKFDTEIYFDENCKMYFVYHNKMKLYFAKFLDTKEKVRQYYKQILIEQDEQSPLRYLNSCFEVKEGDVVVDIGVAEGNFSLEVIKKVSKLYLIEANEEWIEALRKTFEDYLDKIVFIKKFITSIDIGNYATLDNLIHEPVNFIKMDIEGNEWDALLGAQNLINMSIDLKCAICAYHGDFDEILIKNILEKYNMKYSTTFGYMWFPDKIRQTYVSSRLCRGVIRAIKKLYK